MVVMENKRFRLSILPGKGTDVIELLHKPTDTDFCWFTQLGLRKKEAVFSSFQVQYEGGWQEILPNLSGEHWHDGFKQEAYGEVSLTEWSYAIIQNDTEEIAVKFENSLRTLPLRIEKTIRMKRDQAGFTIEETVFNLSPAEIHADWGQHITFGTPFLQPGTRIELPTRKEATITPERGSAGGFEVIHCEQGSYRLMNPQGIGAEVSWDPLIWPYLWFWRDYGERSAAPYYGNHYNVGLEVFSSPPAASIQESINNQSAIVFPPFGQKQSYLNFIIVDGDE